MKRSSIGQVVRGGLSFVLGGRTRDAWRSDPGSGARVVRSLAGCAGGWEPRRGSILVIVLGTLALLSVLTLVYVSQGRSDTRGSAIVVERDEVRRTARDVGDYLAGLVAIDALATAIDGASPTDGSNKLVIRETMDAPFTDPQAVSSPSGNTPVEVLFDAVGDHRDGKARDGTTIDIASLRPRPSDPWLASSEPTQLDPSINAPRRFEEMRDWAHISNIAPDGRFVNLFALRNNFFAKPGRNLTPSLSEPLRMGDAVWLFNDAGARPNPGTNPATMNSPLPLGATGNADRNIPAHWDSYLRHLYRPMRDLQYGPGDPRHLSYSVADADGDGMADSKWQELVDTSDPDNPTSILSTDGPFRWFVAARIVDLSGRVNVNTATEFRKYAGNDTGEPTIDAPTGVTPAEVDLRRLLMLTDVYDDAALGTNVDDRGYKSLLQPTPAGLSDDYTPMTEALAADFGRGAYNALKASILLGQVPAVDADMLDESQPEIAGYGAEQRIEEYLKSRAHATSAGYYAEQTENVFEAGGLPDLTDLTEMLTYNGVNNPATLSRLEQIMGGRADVSGSLPSDNRASPLRDNRGLAVERDASALQVTTGAELGMASDFALLREWIDVRSKLTTISGARPLTPRVFAAATGASAVSTLGAADVRIDAVEAIQGSGTALFRGYADALLPYAGLVGDVLWDNAAPEATLSYGHDARLALRVAGHMAVNMHDLADRDPKTATPTNDDYEPKKFTLRTGHDIASVPIGTAPYDGTFLDLGNGKFEQGANTAEPAAINLWGIEPQPFLTEVASFYVYWDRPEAKGGDADGDTVNPPNPPTPGEITINTTLTNDNTDLLLQALVFQLHNPFDVPLQLADGTATPMFYIEIGEKRYDIADIDPATGVRSLVKLDPGQTMNFYVLCDTYAELKSRWDLPGKMDKFIATQMSYKLSGGTNNPSGFLMPKLAHQTPAQDGDVDLLGSEADSRDIKLKRVSGPAGAFSEHLVIDRLNDPEATATLKRINAGNNEKIAGTTGVDGAEDNTGYMIALWGRVKRHDLDSSSVADNDKRGFLPPWCVEARSGSSRAIAGMAQPFQNWARVDPVGGSVASLKKSNFVDDGSGGGEQDPPPGRDTFSEFVNDFAPIVTPLPKASSVLVRSIRSIPKEKHELNQYAEAMPLNASGKSFSDLLVEIPRVDHQFRVADANNNSGIRDESNLRLVDLLAPLGIGPEQNPGATNPDEEWLTLSESLAIALDYSSTQPSSAFKPWARVGADNGTLFPKLDRGNLVLDDYVPYVNADGVVGFLEGTNANSDRRAGTGVPMALTIMDKFHVAGASYGGLTKATPGLVNLNTAPLNVLRTLPVLTPTSVQSPTNEWWGGTAMPIAGDRAAAVIAYRDRTQVKSRTDQLIQFNDSASISPFDPMLWDGRTLTAGIEALREQTGLASLGEMMAVVDNTGGTRFGNYQDAFDVHANPAIANDSTLPGVATSLYRDTGAATSATLGNEIINEWAEKLAVLGPAAGSASVRSDYYACWFVLHGYREADCLNLSNDKGDPLVPTIAKRYLMVIDRSNVTQRGQKPRVLVFTELPMP